MRDLVPPEAARSLMPTSMSDALANLGNRFPPTTRLQQPRIWQYHNTLRTDGVAALVLSCAASPTTLPSRWWTEKLPRETGEGLLSEVRRAVGTIRKLELFRTLLDHSNEAIEVVGPRTLRLSMRNGNLDRLDRQPRRDSGAENFRCRS